MTDFGETGVAELPKEIAPLSQLTLGQNMPNPFTEQTVLTYQLPAAGNVCLKIYNIAGQLVKTLVDTQQGPGVYNVIWSGLDDLGRRVSSGVYFCRLECKTQSDMKKMTILR
jgi:flagellar hook assembly protein FlgD